MSLLSEWAQLLTCKNTTCTSASVVLELFYLHSLLRFLLWRQGLGFTWSWKPMWKTVQNPWQRISAGHPSKQQKTRFRILVIEDQLQEMRSLTQGCPTFVWMESCSEPQVSEALLAFCLSWPVSMTYSWQPHYSIWWVRTDIPCKVVPWMKQSNLISESHKEAKGRDLNSFTCMLSEWRQLRRESTGSFVTRKRQRK